MVSSWRRCPGQQCNFNTPARSRMPGPPAKRGKLQSSWPRMLWQEEQPQLSPAPVSRSTPC